MPGNIEKKLEALECGKSGLAAALFRAWPNVERKSI
jgi:hypothetical protein